MPNAWYFLFIYSIEDTEILNQRKLFVVHLSSKSGVVVHEDFSSTEKTCATCKRPERVLSILKPFEITSN